MADACIHVMELDEKTASDHLFSYPAPCFVNVGSGTDNTILELAEMIRDAVGFTGRLEFDTSKPDGSPLETAGRDTPRKIGMEAKNQVANRSPNYLSVVSGTNWILQFIAQAACIFGCFIFPLSSVSGKIALKTFCPV